MIRVTSYITPMILLVTIILFAHVAAAGTYGGETTVNATITVGAAASCRANVTEIPLGNLVANGYTTVGELSVDCPGADSNYIGVVGGDGKIGASTCSVGSCSNIDAAEPYWAKVITNDAQSDAVLTIDAPGLKIVTFIPYEGSYGLPADVLSLNKAQGSSGTYAISLSIHCHGTGQCTLKTGSYPYQLKVYGYWQ